MPTAGHVRARSAADRRARERVTVPVPGLPRSSPAEKGRHGSCGGVHRADVADVGPVRPWRTSIAPVLHDVLDTIGAHADAAVAALQVWVDARPRVLQIAVVFLLSVIPVVEGDIAAGIGMVAGVDWELTFLAAAGGTALAAWAAAVWGARIAARRRAGGGAQESPDPAARVPSRRRDAASRVLARVDRYGLGPAMVLCGFVSPVALNTFVLAVAGVDRRRLVFWGVVSAVINVGVVVAGAAGVLHLLSR